MDKILITGINGFVGAYLAQFLSKKGYIIYGLTRNKKDNLQYYNYDEIEDCFQQNYKVVIHTAGKAHDTKNTINNAEYVEVNYKLTTKIYDYFLQSNAEKFIYFSSVKAISDIVTTFLSEDTLPQPKTAYGESKLMAENYLLNKHINTKKTFILRPCMIHGPGNKGNLNLLYNLFSNDIPYPLGAFDNKRSLLGIDNLCFVINKLIIQPDIPSGIYNVADSDAISTKDIIKIMRDVLKKRIWILNISQNFIKSLALIGNFLPLPLNQERLKKLTENYVVSNKKILAAIKEPFPYSVEEGLKKTFHSFELKE